MINSTSRLPAVPKTGPHYQPSGLPRHAPRRRRISGPVVWVIGVIVCVAAISICYWP